MSTQTGGRVVSRHTANAEGSSFIRNVTRVHTCDVCQKSLPMTGFNQKVLANASTHGRNLVCLICSANGYSPKDCTAYSCSWGGHTAGHQKFDPQHLSNWKRGLTSKLLCKTCKTAQARSAATKIKKAKSVKKHKCCRTS